MGNHFSNQEPNPEPNLDKDIKYESLFTPEEIEKINKELDKIEAERISPY